MNYIYNLLIKSKSQLRNDKKSRLQTIYHPSLVIKTVQYGLKRKGRNYLCIKLKPMSLRLLLFILVLTAACRFSTKKADKKQVNVSVEVPINEPIDVLEDTQPHNFKIYPHLDSLKIRNNVSAAGNGRAILSNPNLFLYQDENRKIRIAVEKQTAWHTWEIFDAADYTYDAAIRLENFDNKGQKELIITSFYGMRPQSTMGNEFYGDTEIWDLDNAHQYFGIQHAYHEDDQGRNGDNTYSIDCNLDLQIQPLLVTVLKDKKFSELKVNAGCFKDEKHPKYFQLVGNEVVESTNGTSPLE